MAQAIGRIGNYFNQELFGKPSGLPWALEISPGAPARRAPGVQHLPAVVPVRDDLRPGLAAVLVWLGHHRRIRPWGLFALYVAGYSAYRIFEETIRIDSSEYFLGLRLNFFVAIVVTVAGLAWFVYTQRRPGPGPAPQTASAAAGESSVDPAAEPGDAAGPPGGAEDGRHDDGDEPRDSSKVAATSAEATGRAGELPSPPPAGA